VTETGMDDQGGKNGPTEGYDPLAETDRPPHEPLFNAPWPAVVLLASLALAFAAQTLLLSNDQLVRLALSPAYLREGMAWTLVSHMFLHSGWGHIGMNFASALAFGPPVAHLFGVRGRGPLLFFAFYLLCGVLAGLGYCLLHWNSSAVMLGASGAISGLWGAASRMLGQVSPERGGGMAPILSRPVVTQTAVFVGINVVMGLLGVFGGLNIAWEAHLIGYAAGLLLIGPMSRLVRGGAITP
jgi:membrane associated rhomboid family serine protease